MRIEAVTVCVGYGDFLREVIPWNLPHLTRWLVVTGPEDLETRGLCRRFGLECLVSEEGRGPGGFVKGRLVERALQHTSADGWRLHLDADMVLPSHFGQALRSARPREDTIYGADRVMVRSWEAWQGLRASGYLHAQHDHHALNFPRGLAVGGRWASPLTGYVPVGAFQLWHSSQDEWRGTRVRPYPESHGLASRTDIQHALQWDRARRALLPEVVCVHLESEHAANGSNWAGRRTKRFGPPASASDAAPPVS